MDILVAEQLMMNFTQETTVLMRLTSKAWLSWEIDHLDLVYKFTKLFLDYCKKENVTIHKSCLSKEVLVQSEVD